MALKLGPRLGAAPERLTELIRVLERAYPAVPRVTPMSCGGCPYNTFRDLHEKPGGAIGCSSIRAIEAYDSGVLYIPTMGAGGSIYSGWAPFNDNQHIYQYLGDGSYFHSGRGAIQSCVQGEVNIPFCCFSMERSRSLVGRRLVGSGQCRMSCRSFWGWG